MLFKDAPDLRSDFRIFMPERGQQNLDDHLQLGSTDRLRAGTPLGEGKGKRKLDSVIASGSGSSLPQKRKRRTADKERERELGSVKPPPATSSSRVSLRPSLVHPPLLNLFKEIQTCGARFNADI